MVASKKTSAAKAETGKTAAKTRKACAPKHIGVGKNDMYLAPYEDAIRGRHNHVEWKLNKLTNNGKKSLADFANGHEYFGLHKTARGWVFREWAPNATDIYLVGDFCDWVLETGN